MKLVGYGAMKNGKPFGIWPVPIEHCVASIEIRKAKDKFEGESFEYEVVPVYIGAPLGGKVRASRGSPSGGSPAAGTAPAAEELIDQAEAA